ncbi:MAG: DUF1064 domain-containing protein [Planctomycetota bacterium]|nr:DUF1064 domain-containing protein [Planctomycetota bacterium]
MVKKPHKYRVSPKEQRTYNGDVYHSKAEAIYAAQLDLLLRSGDIRGWERQVKFQLGPDNKTIVDFLVTEWHDVYVVEIKGMETPEFKRVKKLWVKYAEIDMQIMKRFGNRWQVSVLHGKGSE